MKKHVYFVQVGFEFDGAVYLPYAAGAMIAYARTVPEITDNYDFPDIIYMREKLADALEKIKDPAVVAFSCSVWNIEYNKELARRVKERYPDCVICFGGHSVLENGELLSQAEYIDILTFGEGEQTMTNLMLNLLHGEPEKTKNAAFRRGGETICTEREYYYDISKYPSPYLTGEFDELMSKKTDVEWLTVLETNRGCPYSCAYCDWTGGRRMRFFPIEKVLGEVTWLAEHKVTYCFCGDSNFGMYDRDVDIADFIVETKKKYGYPEVFRPCYEKNSEDRVFRICKALNSVKLDKGATFAYQTLCDEALKNIGRKNLTMEHFSGLMKKYNEEGIPSYSELILGLPGETLDSFCRGICRLLENGQHNSLSVYYCEVLPNSRLAEPDYIKQHGIDIIRVAFNHLHSAPGKDEEVKEYSNLVRATATMSRDDWTASNLFSICVQVFHSLGVLRCFGMYLHSEGGMSYYDFYGSLLEFIQNSDGRLHSLWESFKNKYDHSLEGDWNYYNEKFGNVTWFFEEGAFIEIADEPDLFYGELKPFLDSLDMEPELKNQLLRYQRLILRMPDSSPRTETFDWDFYSFINAVFRSEPAKLVKKKTRVSIKPEMHFRDIAQYGKEAVWWGRRRGDTMISNKEMTVEYL